MRRTPSKQPEPLGAPPKTMEERQDRMITLAYNLVEQRLIEGTATSQETTYFLKLASAKERLELEKQQQEIKLAEAKIKALESERSHEELFKQVIDALRSYQGADWDEQEEDVY